MSAAPGSGSCRAHPTLRRTAVEPTSPGSWGVAGESSSAGGTGQGTCQGTQRADSKAGGDLQSLNH